MYHSKACQRNFVSPSLCEQLSSLVDFLTPFYWKLNGNEFELMSNIFDPDEIYSSTTKMLEERNIISTVPAYTFGEMEMMLPDYYIDKVNGKYRILCDQKYLLQDVECESIADGMAIMVIEGLRKRVLNKNILEPIKLKY